MEQKRFVKFGLSIENFRSYVPMIVDEVETFLKTDASFAVFAMNDINEWGKFQALDTLSEITILTAARTLQGAEVRSNMDKTFAQWMMDLDNGFTPINFMFPNLPLPSYRRRDKAQQSFSDFYVNILNKRKEADAVVSKFPALVYV
jgi:sterol 14alpha-demethylase